MNNQEEREITCAKCGKHPNEISDCITGAKVEKITPDQFAMQDGTYNPLTRRFWCTRCYCLMGCPRGKADANVRRIG